MFTLASVTSVYAQTVEIPFDSEKFNPESEDCIEYTNARGELKYLCEFDPVDEVVVTPGDNSGDEIDESTDDVQHCPDRFTLVGDKCIPNVDAERQAELREETDKLLEKFERDFEILKNDPTLSAADKEYLALVEYLGTCQQGTGEAAGIQEERRFAVSTTWINDGEAWLKSIDITGRHAELKMAVEECIYQHTILEPVVLGQWYLNRAIAQDIEQNPYHALRDSVVEIRPYMQDPLTEDDFDRTSNVAQETLCNIASTATLDYCKQESGTVTGGTVDYTSSSYHRYMMYKNGDHSVNTSVIYKNKGTGPISDFIAQQGGYEKAIDAIKWKQHFDLSGQELIIQHED